MTEITKDFYQCRIQNEVVDIAPLFLKLWTVLNFKVLTSIFQHSESRVQRPESRVQRSESSAQSPGFRVQWPESRVQHQGTSIQSPASKVQHSESRVQRPEFRNSGMPIFQCFVMSISFLDACPKRSFQWLIHLTDSDNLKQFLNMEQQNTNFQI